MELTLILYKTMEVILTTVRDGYNNETKYIHFKLDLANTLDIPQNRSYLPQYISLMSLNKTSFYPIRHSSHDDVELIGFLHILGILPDYTLERLYNKYRPIRYIPLYDLHSKHKIQMFYLI